MNKKSIVTLVAFIVLITIAYFFYQQDQKKYISLNDFAVSDTSSIDKIFISNTNGKNILLEKVDEVWMLNKKSKANTSAVDLIMTAFNDVEVRNPVDEALKKTLIKDMAGTHKRVDIYQNGTLSKTWFLGPDTEDKYATYMILEENGKRSNEPFAVEIPGFRGFLSARFFTEDTDWKDQTIFKIHPENIKEISYEDAVNPEQGHIVRLSSGGKDILLFNQNNEEVNSFDTLKIKDYIIAFKAVNHNKEETRLSESKKDSIINNAYFGQLSLTDNNNNSKSIKFYFKDLVDPYVDDLGKIRLHDADHFYGVLDDSSFVKLQYFHMGRVLKPLSYFKN